MVIDIKRREFMAALGGATVALPFVARAQQAALPVVGFLASLKANGFEMFLAGFHDGLREAVSKARTSPSNTVGLTINTIGCLLLRTILFAGKSR
jgi:hypothetical protein